MSIKEVRQTVDGEANSIVEGQTKSKVGVFITLSAFEKFGL
jgi:hypothetical protein